MINKLIKYNKVLLIIIRTKQKIMKKNLLKLKMNRQSKSLRRRFQNSNKEECKKDKTKIKINNDFLIFITNCII